MIPGIAPKTAAVPVAWAPQPRHMFVFGAGFVGRYVSERLLAQGWLVTPHSLLPRPLHPPCFSLAGRRRRKPSSLLPNVQFPLSA